MPKKQRKDTIIDALQASIVARMKMAQLTFPLECVIEFTSIVQFVLPRHAACAMNIAEAELQP